MKKWKEFLASLNGRSFRSGMYAVTVIALVLCMLIAANILLGALPTDSTEYDLTADKRFTLSQPSRDLLDSLDEPVELYWIAQEGTEDSTVQTLLQRYSGNCAQIHLTRIDPDLQPTFTKSYPDEEVNNNGVFVVSQNRYRYVDVEEIYVETFDYTTYSYVYEFDGENAITSAIDYVTGDDLPTLGLVEGHGESPLPDIYKTALKQENILTISVSLPALDDQTDMILLNRPTQDITAEESQALTRYLEGGGDVILVSMISNTETFPNLYGVMAQRGMEAVPGILFEKDTARYYYNPNELIPVLEQHPITEPLANSGNKLLMPDAQGIRITGDAVTALLTTSKTAYSKTGTWPLETSEKEAGDIDGPFAVAAVYEQADAKILWVTSGYLTDAESVNYSANLDLFMNAINAFSQRENRISIRPKPLEDQFLVISAQSANTVKLLLIGAIPLCYLAVGISIFLRRKRK